MGSLFLTPTNIKNWFVYFFRLLDDGVRPILIINLSGVAGRCVWVSVFGLGCWRVVIRFIRCFFGSGLAAIADLLKLAFYEQNRETFDAG